MGRDMHILYTNAYPGVAFSQEMIEKWIDEESTLVKDRSSTLSE